jgi:SAM-dependent methyltransferase
MSALPGHVVTRCRLCSSSELHTFLDFGLQPHSDGFVLREKLLEPEPVFPLAVASCADCGQVQLTYAVSPAYMWGPEYVYDSSVTEAGRRHFLGMATSLVTQLALQPGQLAVDIGSNVGLLLSGFQAAGLRVQGVDPAPEPVRLALERNIPTLLSLFTETSAREVVALQGQADVITGTNVFAHVDDLQELMRGIDVLLAPHGTFVIEAPYLGDLLTGMAYDTIYHQHASYLAVSPLQAFFKRLGFSLYHLERLAIHGGSLRLFVCREGVKPVDASVLDLVAAEQRDGLLHLSSLQVFAQRVYAHRAALIELVFSLRAQGKSIACLSAPAKGNTLLNFCGFNGSVLSFVTERNTLKVGRFTPVSRLEILPDEALLERRPDVALILAYRDAGGQFLIPMPSPTLV